MLNLHARPLSEHFLRGAIALSFLYPPLSALADPIPWIGYIPAWALTLIPIDAEVLLHAFGLVEIVLGLWILIGRDIRIPAFAAAALLLFITITNPTQFLVLFRDLALAFAALALALHIPKTNSPQ